MFPVDTQRKTKTLYNKENILGVKPPIDGEYVSGYKITIPPNLALYCDLEAAPGNWKKGIIDVIQVYIPELSKLYIVQVHAKSDVVAFCEDLKKAAQVYFFDVYNDFERLNNYMPIGQELLRTKTLIDLQAVSMLMFERKKTILTGAPSLDMTLRARGYEPKVQVDYNMYSQPPTTSNEEIYWEYSSRDVIELYNLVDEFFGRHADDKEIVEALTEMRLNKGKYDRDNRLNWLRSNTSKYEA